MRTCKISTSFHSLTEMSPDRNGQTEMSPDRNGPYRNGSDRIGQIEKSRTRYSVTYITYLANTENIVGPGSPLSTRLRTLLKIGSIPER